jgi:hypothetical protein
MTGLLLALLLASAPYDDLFEDDTRGEYVLRLDYHSKSNTRIPLVWRFGLTRAECIRQLEQWQHGDGQDMLELGSDKARGICVHESRVFKHPGVDI